MNIKKFEEFLISGQVKKQTPNKERAVSLIEEAENKKKFLEISLKTIPAKDMNPNFVVDSCYDILIELIRAKMLADGYNAANSHEAEVSYMEKIGFVENDIRTMNELRYYRNGTKYYGTILNREYSEIALKFMERIYTKLRKILF